MRNPNITKNPIAIYQLETFKQLHESLLDITCVTKFDKHIYEVITFDLYASALNKVFGVTEFDKETNKSDLANFFKCENMVFVPLKVNNIPLSTIEGIEKGKITTFSVEITNLYNTLLTNSIDQGYTSFKNDNFNYFIKGLRHLGLTNDLSQSELFLIDYINHTLYGYVNSNEISCLLIDKFDDTNLSLKNVTTGLKKWFVASENPQPLYMAGNKMFFYIEDNKDINTDFVQNGLGQIDPILKDMFVDKITMVNIIGNGLPKRLKNKLRVIKSKAKK